jgi:Thiol-activated cytolysin
MNRFKNLLVGTCLCASYTAISQPLTLKKISAAKINSLKTATAFKFNGKILSAVVKSPGATAVPAERRTVRDGVTKEVIPYDGSSTGAKEVAGAPSSASSNNTICNSQNVTLTAGFNELNLLDPTGVEIWPGRVIKISSIDDGSYNNFTEFTARKDLSIAVLPAGTAQTSVIRSLPAAGISQGTVTNAINSVKNQFGRNDFGSDSWMFESYSFFSTSQFLIEAGAGVNATPINLAISASAGFNSSEKKNKIVLKFVREAYDVKVDSDLGQILEAAQIGPDAGIIASVSYGQFGIIEIQSDSSISDMNAALDFAFNADPTTNISGNLRTQLTSTINSFSIKGIFKGVQGNAAIINLPSINDLKNMLLGNGSITATTPVVPLSFVVKSLQDGATMMLKSSLSYTKRECTVLPPSGDTKLKIKILALTAPAVNDGFSDDEDIFGSIKIYSNAFVSGAVEKTAWSKSKANNVKVKKSETPASPGAYSMAGDATDAEIICRNDAQQQQSKYIIVKVDLQDEEAFEVKYGKKELKVSFAELVQSVNATGTTSIDNFDSASKAFFVDVVETGNSNKVRVWFKAQKIN